MYLCVRGQRLCIRGLVVSIFSLSTILFFEFRNRSDSVIFVFLSFYYFTRENYSILYNPTTEKPSL